MWIVQTILVDPHDDSPLGWLIKELGAEPGGFFIVQRPPLSASLELRAVRYLEAMYVWLRQLYGDSENI